MGIEPAFEEGLEIPYMYFECLDGGLITFGEHCDDCSETFDVSTCGEGATEVASDGSYCFIVPEEDNLVHTVSCSDDNSVAYVHVWVDAADCNDISGIPTEVHEHGSGACDQLAHEHGGEHDHEEEGEMPFEWAGVFSFDGAESEVVWSMQGDADGVYPDASMKLVLFPLTSPLSQADVHDNEETAALLMDGECEPTESGSDFSIDDEPLCFQLIVSSDSNDSEFNIDVAGLIGVAVFAEHVPIEFERDRHYFYDNTGFDIEPAFEEGLEIPYMYFECLDGGLITFGEHCDDCSETFDVSTCGEGATEVASDGSYCFIVPEENDLVHTVSCSTDNSVAYVHVWVDAADCNDISGIPTEVHAHGSGDCDQLAHEHGDEHDEEEEGEAPFEWAGVFSFDGADISQNVLWSMQGDADGVYPDATMKLVLFPVTSPIS